MDQTELCYMTAGDLAKLVEKRAVSPVEIIEAHLQRIDSLELALNSFITLLPEHALAAAKQAEEQIASGNYKGPLHGIPFGLKDLYYTKGVRTTSGTRVFDGFIPEYDCTIAARFREAGAILLGKLNLHQLAYGATGENPDYGNMHNPWDPRMIAGGSSGGSGSAAAAGECTLTMGSDTGGSIRIPSALCGLAGLKPTYGRLSRYGITPLAWSMDHAGPMTRSVEDCALVMNAVAGYDAADPASADVPVPDYTRALTGDIKRLRVGVPKEYFEVPIDPEVEQAVRRAIDMLGDLGATVSEVSWPMYDQVAAVSTVVLMTEASAAQGHLLRTNGAQLWENVRTRLEAGLFFSGSDYLQAQKARTLFGRESRELLNNVDILAGPTLPITAHQIGATSVQAGSTRVGSISSLTQYTRAFNINGFPAITVPCGFSKDGLPIGLQLAGRPFDEETVLSAAHAYEQATDWHKRRPGL